MSVIPILIATAGIGGAVVSSRTKQPSKGLWALVSLVYLLWAGYLAFGEDTWMKKNTSFLKWPISTSSPSSGGTTSISR